MKKLFLVIGLIAISAIGPGCVMVPVQPRVIIVDDGRNWPPPQRFILGWEPDWDGHVYYSSSVRYYRSYHHHPHHHRPSHGPIIGAKPGPVIYPLKKGR